MKKYRVLISKVVIVEAEDRNDAEFKAMDDFVSADDFEFEAKLWRPIKAKGDK